MTRPTASTRRNQLLARTALAGLGIAVVIGATPAKAQVTGVGDVTSTSSNGGAVGVATGGGVTDITTNAGRSIVNWTSLSVTQTEALNFYFNNRSDIVLNRVAGSASIDGILKGCMATCAETGGNIWILSAGGVVIGGNARISTGGFLASTGSVTDTDFLDGDMNFAFTGAPTNSAISVASGAEITTSGGTLALIAPVVTTAAGSTMTGTGGGDVVYGSAENYNVTFMPTGADDLDLISFQVPAQTDGSAGTPGLTLNGTTNANQVFAAIVSKNSVASSILLGGAITATAASGENGDIVLSAGSGFTNGVASTPMGFDGSITQNTTSTLTADNVTMRAANNIVADEINATGRVWLNSEWTSISQTGAITANILRAEAGGDIILTNTGNDFNFLTYIETQGINGIDIVDADGFVIDSYIYHFGGGTRTASLTALTGSISATGSGVIQVGTLNVSAVGGSIDLGNAASNTTNLGTITAGGDFTYRSLLDVNVAGVITASNVTLSSLAGQITQSGGGAILASSLTAWAQSGISLSNANNDVATIAGLSTSALGDIVYAQTDGFQITGAVTTANGGMSLTSTNGSITQTASGIITTSLLHANAGADLILDQANVVGVVGNLMAGGGAGDDVVFNSTLGYAINGTVAGDDVTLTSDGSIGQGASSRIIANRLTLDAAGGIDLPNGGFGTGNDIDALGLVTAGGAVSIASISALDLTADIDTSGANLTLYSQLGITQSGGVLKVGTLYAQSRADGITLNQANEVAALGHIFVESSGDFTFRNVGDIVVNGTVEVIGDDISLTSDTGSVVQNGPGMAAATLSVSAQTGISLDRGNNINALTGLTTAAGAITFNNTYDFDLAGAVSADSVALTSTTGAITQSSGIITADVLTATADGGITLGQANAVTTLGDVTGGTGDVIFVNSGDLELSGDIASGVSRVVWITSTTGAINQTSGTITADWITLDADTTISQSGGATLNSVGLSLASGGNASLGEANDFTTIYGLAVGGDLTLRNLGSIDLSFLVGPSYTSGGALTLTSDTGSIISTNSGIVTSRLTASAAGSITLDGTIASLGDIAAGGNILLTTYNGGMDLTGDVTGQTISLYADTGVTQSGGTIDASRLNVVTNGAISLTGANEIDVIGRLDSDQILSGTGADITLRNVGNIVLDYLVTAPGATVSFTSDTGAISQTSFSAITANRLIASAAGNITIYDGGNDVTTIGGLASVNGDIVYRDINGFDLQGNITANSANRGAMLVAGGSGGITQTSGVLDVGYFRGIAQGGIALGGANLIRRLITTQAGNGALTLNTTTDLLVDGTVVANTVSLTSTGAITQANNAQIWTSTLNASAVTGINLTASGFGANNIASLGTITNTTSGGVTLSNAMNFNLTGNITASGQAVSITNTQGSITQTGGIITAGTLSLSATTGITATASNAVNSLGDVTAGGNVSFTTSGDLDLSGALNTGGGNLTLTSLTGQIVQTGGFITANVLNLAAAGRIWANNANAVTSLGTVTAGGHFLFRNDGNTVVGGDITAGGYDVTLRSNTGSITQTAGSDITSNSLQIIAETGITLTNAGNAINELAWVYTTSGSVAFSQTNGFTISGPVLATGRTVSLTSVSGAINQTGGFLQAGTLNASAAGTLTLNQANNVDSLGVISTGGSFLFRDVTGFDLTGNVTAANQVVMLAQGGSINQTGGIITSNDINAMASADVLLGGANQIGAISALSAGRHLLYRQVGDLSVPTLSAGGTISLYSTTGDITQTGTITADTLVLGAADDIELGQNFVLRLGQIDAGGDFTASNAGGLSSGALELTGDITVGGVMTLVNPGAITQTGGAITATTLSIDTDGALVASGGNSVSGATRLTVDGDVTWNSAGDLNLRVTTPGAATITSTGAILLDGGGASTVGGLLSLGAVTGISQAQTLNVSDFGTLTNTTSGGITLTTASWVELEGNVTAAGQTVALNVTTGGIIQNGGVITANRFSSTTTSGQFLNAINEVDELGVIVAGSGSFNFRTLGNLTIDGDITSAQNVLLTSATGSITQTAGSDITAGGLSVYAETGINLTNAGNDVDRLLTVINLGSGGIAYRQTDGFLIDSTIRGLNQTVSLTSIAGGISETGTTFAQIEAGTLNVSAAGAVTLNRDNAVGTVSLSGTTISFTNVGSFAANVITGGAVSLTSNTGTITQTASTGRIVADSLIASAATGLEFFGGQNDIEFLAGLSSTSGGVTYRDMGGFDITGDISAAGQQVELISDGTGADGSDIVQSGGVITASVIRGTSAGDFILDRANVVSAVGELSAGGDLTYRGAGSLTITGNLTAGSVLTLTANLGAIMQNGGAITADRLNASATTGIAMARVNDVNELGDIDAGSGEFSFRDGDDLDLTGDITAGYGVMLQTGAALTQSGGSLTAPNLSVFSNTTVNLSGGSNDIDNLAISTAIGGLTFVDIDGFTITDRVYSSGTVDLTATTGDIDESVTGYVSAQTLLVRATTGEINLTGDNAVDYLALLQATGDASFNDVDGFAITGNVSADALSLTTADGAIIQSGASQIVADNLYVEAVTGIVLGDASNDVDTITGMVNTTSGGIVYADVDSVNIDGAVTATGQTVTFNVGIDLTQSGTGVITAQTVSGSAGGAFALADAANAVAQLGPVTANSISLVTVDTGLTIVGALNATLGIDLKADDFITQTAAGTVTANTLRAQADGDIILDQGNDLTTIELLYSDFGDITFSDVNGFALNASSYGDVWTGGILTLTAGGLGDIEQFGAGLHADTLIVSAGGYINLDEANRVTNLGALTAGGYIYYYDFDDIALTGDINAGGSFNIVSINGDVTQTGGLITATTITGQSYGDFSLNNFDAPLNSAISTTGDVDISNSGDIVIENLVQVGAGNSVTLTSDGSISSNAAGRIEAGSLTLSAGTNINLTGPARNDVDTLAGVTAGLSFNFIDDDDFSLSGDIDVNGGAAGTTATLRSVGGAIIQTAGAIRVDGFLVEAATGVDLSSANLVGALEITNGSGDVYFTNAQDLGVVSATSGGLVDIETTTGRLDVLGQIIAGSIVLTGANGAYAGDLLSATGDVTVTAVTGNAMAAQIISGDDVLVQALAGSAQLQSISLYADVDPESDGQNVTVTASGNAFLGATSEAGITAQSLNRVSGSGTVSIISTGGDANVFLSSMDTAVSTLSAGGDGATARAVLQNGDLSLGSVTGDNVSLTAHGGMVSATQVTVGGGDYDLTGTDFSSAAITVSGTARDRTITDTAGDLELFTNVFAQRALTIIAQGSVLNGTGSVNIAAGLGGQGGDLNITAASIAAYFVRGDGNVILTALSGGIDIGTVLVAGDYSLTGNGFFGGTLSPLGGKAGTWSLTALGALDFTGRTLSYRGDIDIQAADAITGGSVRSINGSVTVNGADDIDIENLYAETGVTVTAGGALTLDTVDTLDVEPYASEITLIGRSVTVTGLLEAGADISVNATYGAAEVEAATAGGDIIIEASSGISGEGDARLGAASLTGATGDLTITADNGDAILGAADYSLITTDNYFERAAGSTGAVTITASSGGAAAYLDHSADIDTMFGDFVDVTVESGDVSIGSMQALVDDVYAETLDGSLTIGDALAMNGGVGLYATGGDLILTGQIHGEVGTTVQTDGLLDGSLATMLSSGGDLSLIGASVVLDQVSADGAVLIGALDGNAYLEFAEAGTGLAVVASGNATVRGADVQDGISIQADGDIVFGADTKALITADNYGRVSVGGGCGCAGDIYLESFNGNTTVNLSSVQGTFDTIASGPNGDVSIALLTGNLTVYELAGYNITADVNGSIETIVGAFINGGNYSLTANDFLGNVLSPDMVSGSMGDYTIVDTGGGLNMTGVTIDADGDILIQVLASGSLSGDAQLTAGGDLSISARGIEVDTVEAAGDVTLDAGFYSINVATGVTVGGDYTLTGVDFSAATLHPLGAKAGDLHITDTGGNFTYATLSYAGDITISASDGTTIGGAITSANGSIEIQGGSIDVGALSAVNGQIDAYGYSGVVRVASATALDDIYIYTSAGDAILGAATLLGTGSNSLLVNADGYGDAILGSDAAGGITSANVFTSNGATTTARVQAAGGRAFVHLDTSDDITAVTAISGDIGIVVRSGDFSLGSAWSTGQINIDGPDGQLTVGSLTADGNVDIRGADIVLTDVDTTWNLFVTASGDITFGGPGAGRSGRVDVDSWIVLEAGGDVTQSTDARFSAVRLLVDAADISLLGLNQVQTIGAVSGDSFAYRSVRSGGFDIGGSIDVGAGAVELVAVNGGITQGSGYTIVASVLSGSSEGGAEFAGYNYIDALGDFENSGGAFFLNVPQALSIVGTVTSDSAMVIQTRGGGMTIASTGSVSSTASGDAILLASDGVFTNDGGGRAVQAANGRWLIYTQATGNQNGSTAGDTYGGLDGRSYYGVGYDFGGNFSAGINAGNRFVHAYQPILTVTPVSQTVTYNGQIPTLTALITGLINGDTAANAWSGSPLLSGNTSRNVGSYGLSAALGTLLSDMNYAFDFGTGMLVIDPKVLTGTVNADGKTYDGLTTTTGSVTLTGVVTGDDVNATGGAYNFADRNAGVGKVVTATGVVLTGDDAGNYVLDPLATAIADILRRSITGTLTAGSRVYDGSTTTSGSVSLTGVVTGDDVSAAGAYDFADRNAGIGKIVTATGVTLSGDDAGNYDLTGVSTAIADILRRAITGTLTASNRVYDGTTTASGSVSLTGVLVGDDVSAAGAYDFADRNAGIGKVVSATGVTLSGGDADNYDLTGVADAIADILRRSITGTLSASNRVYDGTTTASGSVSLTGVVSGDDVSAAGVYDFADRNAGVGKVVSATGVTLSGGDAGNYDLTGVADAIADILRRSITGTLTASNRVYDGTTTASGSVSLTGVLVGDDVNAAGGAYNFADRNAGVGKVVTATGVGLTGADAGNYDLTAVADAIADILRRSITGTVAASNKTYDGTTSTTATVTLTGVLTGDSVTAGGGSYTFADANAGLGKTVTVSGVTLSGADAGNYDLTGIPGTAIADILRRTVAVTANNQSTVLGQPDPLFTYYITSGSLVAGDGFSGSPSPGVVTTYGDYEIGQGTLSLSLNYSLVFTSGVYSVRPLPSGGQDGSEAFRYLRSPMGPNLQWDPAPNLTFDKSPICLSLEGCSSQVGSSETLDRDEQAMLDTAGVLGWRRFLPGGLFGSRTS